MYSEWLGPFGWGIFFIGLVLSVIFFIVKKKFYPIMYILSICLYIFTFGFIIDAFDLGKNSILLLLAFSSLLFIGAGVYFSYKLNLKKARFEASIPSRKR
jgi:uncharacterized membrane protein YvlD (DUF360 family)